MYTDEDRKYVLNQLLSIIWNISDIAYQKRVWIRAEGPEVDDFGETINYLFDYIEIVFKDYKAYEISENQYQLLVKFRDAFDAFRDEHYHPLEFIDSPEWKKVKEIARETLAVFHYTENVQKV